MAQHGEGVEEISLYEEHDRRVTQARRCLSNQLVIAEGEGRHMAIKLGKKIDVISHSDRRFVFWIISANIPWLEGSLFGLTAEEGEV